MSTSRAGSRSSQVNPEAPPTYLPLPLLPVWFPPAALWWSLGGPWACGRSLSPDPLSLSCSTPTHFGTGAAMEALFGLKELDDWSQLVVLSMPPEGFLGVFSVVFWVRLVLLGMFFVYFLVFMWCIGFCLPPPSHSCVFPLDGTSAVDTYPAFPISFLVLWVSFFSLFFLSPFSNFTTCLSFFSPPLPDCRC